MLGKRKSRKDLFDSNDKGSTSEAEHLQNSQALFRQHFEASFKPLESVHQSTISHEIARSHFTEDQVESDWEGISDEEHVEAQVVAYQNLDDLKPSVGTDEFKSFMTSKPPSSSHAPESKSRQKQSQVLSPADAITDAENLKKDLALQRLLKESHLLDPQSFLNPSGSNRHKAMDLRLQEIGSKSSLYHQRNMPLSQRRGIARKVAEKEESRRRDAKENGIILEKAIKKRSGGDARRQRGIGAPSVGRFKGGTLKLSKQDVREIQGPKKISKARR